MRALSTTPSDFLHPSRDVTPLPPWAASSDAFREENLPHVQPEPPLVQHEGILYSKIALRCQKRFNRT